MTVRWWPRRWSSAARRTQRVQQQATDQRSDNEQARAAAVGYGRVVRALQQQYPDEDLHDGSAYVCGVGTLPVPLLVALADLEDAREQARAHPEEPALEDAVYRATKAYIVAARATQTQGRAGS